MTSRLKLGMVGGGDGAFIGAVHRMAARLDGRWELVAGAFQSDPGKSVAFGRSLGLNEDRCYPDFKQMATDEAKRSDPIDAVAIVTPNHMHHPVACVFLDAGIAIICDKPLTTSADAADEIARRVRDSGLPFIMTHNYSAYPMIREARARVSSGRLGAIRLVEVEYAQDWLATELPGNKQSAWRGDPKQAGPGGALGDIATHAFQLAEFVAGARVEHVAADLSAFVANRKVDDNVHAMLRFAGGARGMLWASQVAVGAANGLRIRVYGERGSISWAQETPDTLELGALGEPNQVLRRGGPGVGSAAQAATRLPGGHPEGYLEAFAQIYCEAADIVSAHKQGSPAPPTAQITPGVVDGVRGVAFIEAAIASSQNNCAWTPIKPKDGD